MTKRKVIKYISKNNQILILSKISNCSLSEPFPIFRSLCLITLYKANESFTGSISLIWRHDLSSFEDLEGIGPFSFKIEVKSLFPLLIEAKCIPFPHEFDIAMFPHFLGDVLDFDVIEKFVSLNVLSDLFVPFQFWGEGRLYMDADMIEETVDMQVDCVEVGWLCEALEDHSVHLTEVRFVLCH